MSEKESVSEIKHSTKIHASYAIGSFFDDFIITCLGIMVFKFYETEVFNFLRTYLYFSKSGFKNPISFDKNIIKNLIKPFQHLNMR